MFDLVVIDALIRLSVLFYRYFPLPVVRMAPLLLVAKISSIYLRWRKGR